MAEDISNELAEATAGLGEALVGLIADQNERLRRLEEALKTEAGQRVVAEVAQEDIGPMLTEVGYVEGRDWYFQPDGQGVTIPLKLAVLLLLYSHENGMPEPEDLEDLWPGYRDDLYRKVERRLGL